MSQGIQKISENVISPGRSLTIVNNSIQDNKNFSIGTLKCYPNDSGLRYKSGENTYNLFDAMNILQEYSIDEILMNNNSVSTRTIKDQNVTTPKIKDLNITNIKLENKSANTGIIAYEKIKDETIVTSTLSNQCVTNPKIHDKTIDAKYKIMNETITTELLVGGINSLGQEIEGCVTTPKIANKNITTAKLDDECVVNDKIAINTIENSKIKDFTIEGGNTSGISKIAEKTITNFNIANKTITTSKFANGSVTGYAVDNIINDYSIIADNTITNNNVANNTLTNIKFASKTIEGAAASDGGKIAFQTITGDNILDASIGSIKFDQTVNNILDNAVMYERDAENKLCVKVKGKDSEETCYMNISGHLDVQGDITGARVYNMAYSDLAEGYVPGEDLEPGDIVSIEEDGKVYKTDFKNIHSVVGVVSDEYATCYGATMYELCNGDKVAVALIGKVHVKVKGDVRLGQSICPIPSNSKKGIARSLWGNRYKIGKALESKKAENENTIHKVLCLVFPN